MGKQHRLIEIEYPDFGTSEAPPAPGSDVFGARIAALRAAMLERGLSHLVVYGDREHFANLAYLTGFDPRFEESLLIVAAEGDPLIIVGNECEGYLGISPLVDAGKLRHERFQSFSLLNQPRGASRPLAAILRDEGIAAGATVGCVGWKYFEADEHPDAAHAIDLPAYVVDTLRSLAGAATVVNATDLLMHPRYGLRTVCTPDEIAAFEYANTLAAEGLKRMLLGMRPGMTDHEVVALAQIDGTPFGCHVTFATGGTRSLGMASPRGEIVRRGEPLSTNLSYWGSNICRSGWIAETAADLPENARDYVETFAGPYFEVMAEWFNRLRIGTPGKVLSDVVANGLPFAKFGIFLNAGHLIHLDEWVSSPIYPGSEDPIRSGMVIQVDVIPSSPVYFSTRMEDGVAVADAALRRALAERHPGCYERCVQRRRFMGEVLGIELPEEVLPLSNLAGIVPPFLLAPRMVLALK